MKKDKWNKVECVLSSHSSFTTRHPGKDNEGRIKVNETKEQFMHFIHFFHSVYNVFFGFFSHLIQPLTNPHTNKNWAFLLLFICLSCFVSLH